MTDLSQIPDLELIQEIHRRRDRILEENSRRWQEEKRGDCTRLPRWNVKDCCASCHDPSRSDTELVEVEIQGEMLKVCCHAERWIKTGDWHS